MCRRKVGLCKMLWRRRWSLQKMGVLRDQRPKAWVRASIQSLVLRCGSLGVGLTFLKGLSCLVFSINLDFERHYVLGITCPKLSVAGRDFDSLFPHW